MDKGYTIKYVQNPPQWESIEQWRSIPFVWIDNFHPEGSDHKPVTIVRVIYNQSGLYGLFEVKDTYVVCRYRGFQEPVWKDSCVEFFVQPNIEKGYFNFEFNCGGAMLCSWVKDYRISDGKFRNSQRLTADDVKGMEVFHTLPSKIEPEIQGLTEWQLGFHIPFTVFKTYIGELGEIGGMNWRGNFYKCADESSHPHWASWSPVKELNFHMPDCFGTLRFEEQS